MAIIASGASILASILLLTNMTETISLQMRMNVADKQTSYRAIPVLNSPDIKSAIAKFATVAPLVAVLALTPQKSFAKETATDSKKISPSLNADAYTQLGDMKMCKILTGMWQVSGAHGYEPQKQSAVSEMNHCAGDDIGRVRKNLCQYCPNNPNHSPQQTKFGIYYPN